MNINKHLYKMTNLIIKYWRQVWWIRSIGLVPSGGVATIRAKSSSSRWLAGIRIRIICCRRPPPPPRRRRRREIQKIPIRWTRTGTRVHVPVAIRTAWLRFRRISVPVIAVWNAPRPLSPRWQPLKWVLVAFSLFFFFNFYFLIIFIVNSEP